MRVVRFAVAGALLVAGATVAAAQQGQAGAGKQQGRGGRGAPPAGEQRGPGAAQRGPGGPMAALGGALFAGIQLTEQERTQIQTIREKYQEELRPERPDERPNTDELRKARQSGDTAALRVAMEAQRAQRAEVMKAQMEKSQAVIARAQGELRAALLPEHREQFDANVAKLKERRENAPGATAPRGGAGGKAGRRGPPPPAQRGR